MTVSIVNHENRESVLRGLGALYADAVRRLQLEIVVVDNASEDGSAAAIRAAFPEVQVVERRDRAGYGANHNVVLRRARGRHVLFLNDDARVEPGAVDALSARLDSDPGVAVAAPSVRNASGLPEPTLWPRPSLRHDLSGAVRLGRARPVAPASGEAIGWAMGCALMVRRDAALAVGGFDEGYFMYSEEIDLCTRLADAGYQIAHVPGAVVVHEGQASTGLDSPERAVEMARSRRRYWHRHYSRPARLAAQWIVAVQFTAMALAAAARRRPTRPLLLQAAGSLRDVEHPGLRERAEAFNRSRATDAPRTDQS